MLPDGVGVRRRGAVEGRVSGRGGFGRECGALDAVPAEPAGRVPLLAPADEILAVAGSGDQVRLDSTAGHRALPVPVSEGHHPAPRQRLLDHCGGVRACHRGAADPHPEATCCTGAFLARTSPITLPSRRPTVQLHLARRSAVLPFHQRPFTVRARHILVLGIAVLLVVTGAAMVSASAAAPARKPVFAIYYLWWTTNHWHDKL